MFLKLASSGNQIPLATRKPQGLAKVYLSKTTGEMLVNIPRATQWMNNNKRDIKTKLPLNFPVYE